MTSELLHFAYFVAINVNIALSVRALTKRVRQLEFGHESQTAHHQMLAARSPVRVIR